MEGLVFRSVKSIVLFFVMYWSLKYLGVSNGAATVVVKTRDIIYP